MKVVILHTDMSANDFTRPKSPVSFALEKIRESTGSKYAKYIPLHEIKSYTIEELLEYANPAEYKNYSTSMYLSNIIAHLEKTISGLYAKIPKIESIKEKHERSMEKVLVGSSITESLKPSTYHKQMPIESVSSIENILKEIKRLKNEKTNLSKSRTSLHIDRGKLYKRKEILMKKFNADKAKLLNIVTKCTDISYPYIDVSPNKLIPTSGEDSYRNTLIYKSIPSHGKYSKIQFTSIVLKINRLTPKILMIENALDKSINESDIINTKSSEIEDNIDHQESLIKDYTRGTPIEHAGIDRYTTPDSVKQKVKKYTHIEDALHTSDLSDAQLLKLKRARRLRDSKLTQIEELNQEIKRIKYRISQLDKDIDFTYVEGANRFAHDIYTHELKRSSSWRHNKHLVHPVSKAMFFLYSALDKHVIIHSLIKPLCSLDSGYAISVINAVSKYPMDKTLYLTSTTQYISTIADEIDAELVQFSEISNIQEFNIQDFLSLIRR